MGAKSSQTRKHISDYLATMSKQYYSLDICQTNPTIRENDQLFGYHKH